MRDHLIKSTLFFQDLLCSYFQCIKRQVIETLLLLCVCHLFGLYTRIKSPMPWNFQKQGFIGT